MAVGRSISQCGMVIGGPIPHSHCPGWGTISYPARKDGLLFGEVDDCGEFFRKLRMVDAEIQRVHINSLFLQGG